jgi:hypothetical protein
VITREQVADLQPGDVVEVLRRDRITIAEVGNGRAYPWLADGSDPAWESLTVVSRAPRLYVNHPRTEPVPGDVVRDADDENSKRTWRNDNDGRFCWWGMGGGEATFNSRAELPDHLRLLVDGQTGEVVTGAAAADAWDEGFEAGSRYGYGTCHSDPPANPYETGQAVQ